MTGVIAASAENLETRRVFLDGSTRSHALLRSAAVGLGVYRPGWRWSRHAGPQTGKPSENHVGYVLSGSMMIQDTEGREQRVEPASRSRSKQAATPGWPAPSPAQLSISSRSNDDARA